MCFSLGIEVVGALMICGNYVLENKRCRTSGDALLLFCMMTTFLPGSKMPCYLLHSMQLYAVYFFHPANFNLFKLVLSPSVFLYCITYSFDRYARLVSVLFGWLQYLLRIMCIS